MTWTLERMADRFAIEDMLAEYCHIIDKKQFDRLDEIFSHDAWIDYTAMGGIAGNREEIKAFLKQAMPAFPSTQHMISNYQIQVGDAQASGRIMCFNPMQMQLGGSDTTVFFLGLWYVDEYVKSEQGWRIRRRVEEKSWAFNTPSFMNL